ncbi:sensor histidine kinase [Roseivirga sp.]|uniref:sensor histidine kinase n=1 Tax=Roseivirga sp. TaxID=1964215 RepID=UPI003B8C0B27
MKKRANKPLIAILFILIIPVIVYGVFELNSLTADERELEKIYQRQLESVLFSINQSVQDKVSDITTMMDRDLGVVTDEEWLNELSIYNFFWGLYLKDATDASDQLYTLSQYEGRGLKQVADSIYSQNESVFDRLLQYKEAGDFMKIEKSDKQFFNKGKELDFFFFVLGSGESAKFGIYFFDAVLMIEQYLVPKFQEIARDDFILTCRRISDGYIVYSTVENIFGSYESEPIDLLPKYEIGIDRAGGTVREAVDRRKTQSMIALGLLMVVMIIGIILVFRSIQQEMKLAQKKADFVSNVSHEIRTPLALINMFAETLLMDRVRTEEKKKEYYGIITKEVSRLTNMVNRILSFSKIEASKRTYDKRVVDLNKVIEEVFNTYSYHLENNGFKHAINLHSESLHVEADHEALIEVLVNLLDNGMKYSQDEKDLVIASGLKNDMAFVSVTDHGMGIPKNQLDKLFEKFYRVPTGDVHDTKGSGLGLTIVQHIMDAHQGKVEVTSTVGKGSTFKLFFPLHKNENA